MSKQQASGSQRTPADCPCDKTGAEDQDVSLLNSLAGALMGSVKRCLETGILTLPLVQTLSNYFIKKLEKNNFQDYFTV